MRILSRNTLRDFWEAHPDAEEALKTWYYEASHANWQSPTDIKAIGLTQCRKRGKKEEELSKAKWQRNLAP